MFLPIGDSPEPRNFKPVATWAVIAANVAIYLLFTLPLSVQGVDPRDPALAEYLRQLAPSLPGNVSVVGLSRYDLYVFAHGYKPAAPALGDLLGSMFLHANFAHLAGNMLFLWIYGRNVEHRLGRAGFLLSYLGTGIAATLAFGALEGGSMTPMIGASGAIAGVLGLYFIMFPRNRVKVLVALPPFLLNVFLVPARLVLGLYIVVDNLWPLLFGAGSSVAYGAHLGGFVAGVLVAMAGERLAWEWPWRDPLWRLSWGGRPGPGASAVSQDALGAIRSALATGDREAALKAAGGMTSVTAARLDPEECVVLSRWMRDAGWLIAATNLLRLCISAHSQSEELATVYLALGLMRLEQGQPTAAYQHLLSVFDHNPEPEVAARARQVLARIENERRTVVSG